MKRIYLVLLTLIQSLGQGLIDFDNRLIHDPVTRELYSAPVTLPDGTFVSGSAFTAGLFLVQSQTLTPVVTTPFREPAVGYFVPIFSVEVPGLPAWSPATFRVRVWETAAGSFDNAVTRGRYYGEFATRDGSHNLFIPALGMPNAPAGMPNPDMGGIQPLTLIPEPATTALAALGVTFLLIVASRRKAGR